MFCNIKQNGHSLYPKEYSIFFIDSIKIYILYRFFKGPRPTNLTTQIDNHRFSTKPFLLPILSSHLFPT